MTAPSDHAASDPSSARWFLRGMRAVLSVPALILLTSFLGYGALARDAGLTMFEAAFSTASIWAVPGQVVLLSSMSAGVGLLGTAVAVGLSAVRLLPMTVSLMPVMRSPGLARWKYFFAAYFIAVTAWVVAMQRLPDLPRPARFPFFAGFAVTIASCGTLITALSFLIAGSLPPLFAAALVFLTPVYFLTSLYGAAKLRSDRLALIFGMALWPLLDWLVPSYALLLTGIVAGTGAFLVHRLTAEPPPPLPTAADASEEPLA